MDDDIRDKLICNLLYTLAGIIAGVVAAIAFTCMMNSLVKTKAELCSEYGYECDTNQERNNNDTPKQN